MPQESSTEGETTIPDLDCIKPFLAKLYKLDTDLTAFCSDEEFRAICNYYSVNQPFVSTEMPSPVVEAVSMHANAVPEHLPHPPHCRPQMNLISAMSTADWAKVQRDDPVIGRVLQLL